MCLFIDGGTNKQTDIKKGGTNDEQKTNDDLITYTGKTKDQTKTVEEIKTFEGKSQKKD